MRDEEDIYLSDNEYLSLLKRIHKRVNEENFVPDGFDDTTMGSKSTETNFGLCSPSYVTRANSLWPEQFPSRRSMKYTRAHHRCLFDKREVLDGNGCFYTCYYFKGGRNVVDIRRMADEQLKRGVNNRVESWDECDDA